MNKCKYCKGAMIICLGCQIHLDCHHPLNTNHPTPKAGDYVVCGYCKLIMLLNDKMKPRLPSTKELEEAVTLLDRFTV